MLRRLASTLLLAVLVTTTSAATAQDETQPSTPPIPPEADVATAPVSLDGRVLFLVRGISIYPPEERAAAIAARIAALAADPEFVPRRVQVVESENSTDLKADQRLVVAIFDADASIEGVPRQALAAAYAERVRTAIERYRRERSPEQLRLAALHAAIATALFVPSLWLLIWLMRRLGAVAGRRYAQHAPSVGVQTFQILQPQRIWAAVRGAIRALRLISIALLAYLYVQFVLGLFPWTRPTAHRLSGYFIDPLAAMGNAILDSLPDLVFLTVLIILTRYALRILRLFFESVERRAVTLQNFEPEWAAPTYRIVRVGVLVFAVVVAYPYIPGSGSEAFKAISIFLGVILSIGSTSFISNIVAGYTLIYRRAFKVGDRVKIEEVIGDVVHPRLLVTQLRSLKNEEIIVPNSLILNSLIVNYSSLARQQGLILHTTVGIGYETPWRKVEAMLLLAAQRTPGFLRDPEPYVMQKALGDFSITYELNAYCDNPQAMFRLYSALHRNILDVFNEYEVQIMTPAYEGDPAQPKIVPRDLWFEPPAAAAAPEHARIR
jgi:small-conductance mechanosensitive channel